MHAIALWLTLQCISFRCRCANLIPVRSWCAAVVFGSCSHLLLIRPVCWHISSWILLSPCYAFVGISHRHIYLRRITVVTHSTPAQTYIYPCNFVYRWLFSFALWHKNFAYFVASLAACGMFICATNNCAGVCVCERVSLWSGSVCMCGADKCNNIITTTATTRSYPSPRLLFSSIVCFLSCFFSPRAVWSHTSLQNPQVQKSPAAPLLSKSLSSGWSICVMWLRIAIFATKAGPQIRNRTQHVH